MATVEALRTRLDTLQWEANRLEAENRRLREEHPEESRAVTLEAELERSKNEAAELRDRISELEQQTENMSAEAATNRNLTEQLETERQTLNELREALERSEARESELTEALEEKGAELERYRAEGERRAETRELQYYRALENEREKWELREGRALAEVDRLRGDKGGTTSANYIALSEQLEEAHQQLQHLQEVISEKESVVCNLRRQLEECCAENEELKDELNLLRTKVQRSEQSASESLVRDDPGATLPSSRLDVGASVFRPAVHFSLPGGTTSQTLMTTVGTGPPAGAMEWRGGGSDIERPPVASPGGGVTHPRSEAGTTSVTSTSTTAMTSTAVTSTQAVSGGSPATTNTGVHPSIRLQERGGSAVGATVARPPAVLGGERRILTPAPGVVTTPIETASYSVVHPNHLPQIPNFHGGDQRDGETFEDWWDHFEAVASIARWDQSFKLVHLAAALRGNARSFYRSCQLRRATTHS